jgi:hypothetical protein
MTDSEEEKLPQEDPEYHQSRVVIYNIPELVQGSVKVPP